ncbi:MAG TPA: hypothetical protein PK970_05275 [Hyphomicrobiaceae bacterium]|nr:hypothetical protein [Hyphomicrobiaceae bacterium]
MTPNHANPAQWEQSQGYARAVCARLFRDGGKPADALKAFGLPTSDVPRDWAVVVDRIAASMCTPAAPMRKAA